MMCATKQLVVYALLFGVAGCTSDPATPAPARNRAPTISSVQAAPRFAAPGEIVRVDVVAKDADGDRLTYGYDPSEGFIAGAGPSVNWTLPRAEGDYRIVVTVSDGQGGTAKSSANASVATNFGALSGRVTAQAVNPDGTQIQIYRGLADYENGECLFATSAIASAPGTAFFSTPILTGIYYVVAVKDLNGNGLLEPGEPHAYYGQPGPPNDVLVFEGRTTVIEIRVGPFPGPRAEPIANCLVAKGVPRRQQ